MSPAIDPHSGLQLYELSHVWGHGVPSMPGDDDVKIHYGPAALDSLGSLGSLVSPDSIAHLALMRGNLLYLPGVKPAPNLRFG